jgi:hypothetical protein
MPTHFTTLDFDQDFPDAADGFPTAVDNENFIDAVFFNALAWSIQAIESYLITYKETIEAVEQDSFSGADGDRVLNIPPGWYGAGKTATAQDNDLVEDNIKKDVVLFGVTGTLVGSTIGAPGITPPTITQIEETPVSVGPISLSLDSSRPGINVPTVTTP